MKKKVKEVIEDIKLETLELSNMSFDELSKLSQQKHQADVAEYDKQQNSLCKIVIGAILLIIGILFFVLSLKKSKNKFAGVDFTSLQFYVFVICTAIGVVLLVIGIVRMVKASKKRKLIKQDIVTLANYKKQNI